jgi:hypothetical protein
MQPADLTLKAHCSDNLSPQSPNLTPQLSFNNISPIRNYDMKPSFKGLAAEDWVPSQAVSTNGSEVGGNAEQITDDRRSGGEREGLYYV